MSARRHGRPRREDGLTLVGALLIFALVALAGGIVLTGQLAVATSDGARAQHGADAAALAGAQAVLDEIPTDVTPGFLLPDEVPVLLGGAGCLTTGQAEADRLAVENGDHVTSYCYDALRDEIRVEVQTDGQSARKAATAATSFDAGSCTFDRDLEPRPAPTGADSGAAPDPGTQHTLVDCGISALQILYNPADARFHFVGLAAALADVKPRLTR